MRCAIFLILLAFTSALAAKDRTTQMLAEFLGLSTSNVHSTIDAAKSDGNEEKAVCLKSLSPQKFTEATESFLNGFLTISEQKAAVKFFASPLGSRYLKNGERDLRRMNNLPDENDEIKFSESDIAELIFFANSPVGKKLISPQFATRLRADKGMNDAMDWMRQQCK